VWDLAPVQHCTEVTALLCGTKEHVKKLHSQLGHANGEVAMLEFTDRNNSCVRVMVFSSTNILVSEKHFTKPESRSSLSMCVTTTLNEVDCNECQDKMHTVYGDESSFHVQRCFVCGLDGKDTPEGARVKGELKSWRGYHGLAHAACMGMCSKCANMTMPVMGPDARQEHHSVHDMPAVVFSECVLCSKNTTVKPMRLVAGSKTRTNEKATAVKRKKAADKKAMPPPASRAPKAEQMLLYPMNASSVDTTEEPWDLATRARYDPKTESWHSMAEDGITRLPIGNLRFRRADGKFIKQPILDKDPTEIEE
jgi:hypothetical protein